MRAVVLVGACLGFVFASGVRAWQGSATPAPKPLVPAAADSIAANPDAFYGQSVTVYASVDRVLSPTSFVIDQDAKASGKGEVVVLVNAVNAPLSPNQYVTVI